MSIFEIPYRIKQLFQKKIELMSVSGKPLENINIPKTKSILKIDVLDIPLFDNEFSVFGKKVDFFNTKLDWHKDIFSEESYQKTFSKSINIRNNPNLSAKNVWELNRLQFLTQIAINYRLTKNKKYLNKFIEINESWIESNPYLLGINWYSNIEVNIRLINWFFCWELMDVENLKIQSDTFKEFTDSKWLPSIYQHCKYSYANPSKFSSANNHLISEYAGLYIASSLWGFKESNKWRLYAKEGLETEIAKQHSNGINKEEAAEYIQFITDFFLLPYVIANKNKDCFSQNYEKTLKEIFDYIRTFTDIKLNFPKYGDEDDGYVLNFSETKHFNNFKSLLVSASVLFFDASYLNKESIYDIKNQLLFQEDGKALFDKLKKREVTQLESAYYPFEGHFIFRKRKENKEIYAHLDVAPLGYLSIAAHGHSDILSFLITINGNPFFIDSGTYSYHTEKKWRNYFVSSKAHNTITIDDLNQAFHASDTMWLNHYNPKVLSHNMSLANGIENVVGTYNEFSDVQHIRSFTFDKGNDEITILDEILIRDNKIHKVFLPFHLHPKVIVKRKNEFSYELSNDQGVKVGLDLDKKINWDTICGGLDPLLGWYSESFMKKEPTSVICGEICCQKNIKIITKIKIYEY